MKTNLSPRLFAVVTLLGLQPLEASAFSFSSFPGTGIIFDGAGAFTCEPVASNLQIDTGTAAGLLGCLEGTFSMGAPVPHGPGSLAPITGSGFLKILDGGTPLMATVSWISIFQRGTGLTLNVDGEINVTDISYAGANPDLVSFAANSMGRLTLTLQFTPERSLGELKTALGTASFSGTAVGVPDSSETASLIGLGVLLLAAATHRRRSP